MSTIRSDLDTAKRQLETAIEVSTLYDIYFFNYFLPQKTLKENFFAVFRNRSVTVTVNSQTQYTIVYLISFILTFFSFTFDNKLDETYQFSACKKAYYVKRQEFSNNFFKTVLFMDQNRNK